MSALRVGAQFVPGLGHVVVRRASRLGSPGGTRASLDLRPRGVRASRRGDMASSRRPRLARTVGLVGACRARPRRFARTSRRDRPAAIDLGDPMPPDIVARGSQGNDGGRKGHSESRWRSRSRAPPGGRTEARRGNSGGAQAARRSFSQRSSTHAGPRHRAPLAEETDPPHHPRTAPAAGGLRGHHVSVCPGPERAPPDNDRQVR